MVQEVTQADGSKDMSGIVYRENEPPRNVHFQQKLITKVKVTVWVARNVCAPDSQQPFSDHTVTNSIPIKFDSDFVKALQNLKVKENKDRIKINQTSDSQNPILINAIISSIMITSTNNRYQYGTRKTQKIRNQKIQVVQTVFLIHLMSLRTGDCTWAPAVCKKQQPEPATRMK